MTTLICPHCGTATGVRKWGHNRAGTQRFRCLACQRNFTPAPKEQGHGVTVHEHAVQLYLEGMSLRAIGRLLGVVHQSVANWVAAAAQRLPERVTDATPAKTIEVDELYTFVEEKKGKSTS
jgi:transposase-like protein